MKKFLSFYSPRLIRSVVYMLQASEYDIRAFRRWCYVVKDFRSVENRKQLDKTPKARLLLAVGWISALILFVLIVFAIIGMSLYSILAAAALVFLAPYLVITVLMCATIVLGFIHTPIEKYLCTRAHKKLIQHKGVRIAIAGSYGKTSIREILKTILSVDMNVATPTGSQNTPIGIARFIMKLKGDEDVVIFELGEYYPGDIRTLSNMVQPQWGIITGVNEAHLEKFKTLENAAATIFELQEFVTPEQLYVNGENETARMRAPQGSVVFSKQGAGNWRVGSAESDISGTRITMERPQGIISAQSQLLGIHQVGPICAAADIASRLGLSNESIRNGIERTKAFAHRLEPSKDALGVTFLDDSYNGNPDGVRAVIQFLASLKNRRFYITPGLVEMGDSKIEIHRTIGEQLAAARIEYVVLIRNSVTPYIEEGLRRSNFSGVVYSYDDMPTALRALSSLTLPGDVVLIQNDWPDQYV